MIYKNNTVKYVLVLFITVLIALDQIVKFIMENTLSKYYTLPIIPSVLNLTYTQNYGAAFGIFQHHKILLICLTSIILISIIVFFIFNNINNNVMLWSLSLIISGGMGNLIDRIMHEYVIDYIDFRLINLAVFNLADCYVFIGVCLMLYYTLFIDRKSQSQ